jgi:hypothetical protein
MEFSLTPPLDDCGPVGRQVMNDLSKTFSSLCSSHVVWEETRTPEGRLWFVLRPRPSGKYWPTPTTMDSVANRKLDRQMLRNSLGLAEMVRVGCEDCVLNPDFSAQVMGAPDGWLDV